MENSVGIPSEVEFRKTAFQMEKQRNLGNCPSLLPLEMSLLSAAGKTQVHAMTRETEPSLCKQSKNSIFIETENKNNWSNNTGILSINLT